MMNPENPQAGTKKPPVLVGGFLEICCEYCYSIISFALTGNPFTRIK